MLSFLTNKYILYTIGVLSLFGIIYFIYYNWKHEIEQQKETEIFYNIQIEKNKELEYINNKILENINNYEQSIKNMQEIQFKAKKESSKLREINNKAENENIPESTRSILKAIYDGQQNQ